MVVVRISTYNALSIPKAVSHLTRVRALTEAFQTVAALLVDTGSPLSAYLEGNKEYDKKYDHAYNIASHGSPKSKSSPNQ